MFSEIDNYNYLMFLLMKKMCIRIQSQHDWHMTPDIKLNSDLCKFLQNPDLTEENQRNIKMWELNIWGRRYVFFFFIWGRIHAVFSYLWSLWRRFSPTDMNKEEEKSSGNSCSSPGGRGKPLFLVRGHLDVLHQEVTSSGCYLTTTHRIR